MQLNSKLTGAGPAVSLAVSLFFRFFSLCAWRVGPRIFFILTKKCPCVKKCRKEWPYISGLFVWIIYRMAAYQATWFSLLGCWGNKIGNYPADISSCFGACVQLVCYVLSISTPISIGKDRYLFKMAVSDANGVRRTVTWFLSAQSASKALGIVQRVSAKPLWHVGCSPKRHFRNLKIPLTVTTLKKRAT